MVEIRIRGGIVIVDDIDAHLVMGGGWGLAHGYVRRTCSEGGKKFNVVLHRLILGASPTDFVDHINGIRHDNRRCNLRLVTRRQNNLNAKPKAAAKSRHGFKGLQLMPNGAYRARIRDGIKQINLGSFATPVAAAYAYDMASMELHGEFGRRNFLPLVV